LAAEASAVEHMNADHRDALNLYATKLLGAAEADWRCTGCDPEGLDMQDGQAALRLDFPERVTDGTGLRKMLVRLAGEARTKVDQGATA
jgi:putative heme iron utilization protein